MDRLTGLLGKTIYRMGRDAPLDVGVDLARGDDVTAVSWIRGMKKICRSCGVDERDLHREDCEDYGLVRVDFW